MKVKKCTVDNCENIVVAKGYCDRHRKQIERHGRLTPEKEHKKICTIEGCEKKHISKGYCRNHYYKYVIKAK